MRAKLVLALAVSLAPVFANAMAAEFTFTVPVDLKGLSPAVKGYLPTCNVYTAPLTDPNWKLVGSSSLNIQGIPPGQTAVKGMYTLAFDHQPGLVNSASAGKWYVCGIALCSSASDFKSCSNAVLPGTAAAKQVPAWAVSAPGAMVSVSGPLP
jgi:hypothetical protein